MAGGPSRKANLESTWLGAKHNQASASPSGAVPLLGLGADDTPGSAGLRGFSLLSCCCWMSLPLSSPVTRFLTPASPVASFGTQAWCWCTHRPGGSSRWHAPGIGGEISLGSQNEWQKPTT